MEAEAEPPEAKPGDAGVRAEVEQHVWLVEDEVLFVLVANAVDHAAIERSEDAGVECGAAGGVGATAERGAGPGLVQEVVAEDTAVMLEAAGHPRPGGCVAMLDRDPTGAGVVRPEVVEGAVEPRAREVGSGKARHRIGGQPIVEHRPVGPALPAELLVVEVLMEVDQREEAMAGKHLLRRAQPPHVAVHVSTRLWLKGLLDHAQPHRVESVLLQEGRVVGAEAHCGGLIRRPLVDHVDPVQDHDAPAAVGDPAPGLAQRPLRGRRAGESGRRWIGLER